MKLKLLVSDLNHIKEKSFYNNNYYKLPININDCNILFGKSDDDYLTVWSLGKFVDMKFEVNCYLGESSIYNPKIEEYIDLSEANEEMIWY